MTPATSDAGRVVACVQHGNSFLEINNGHKRFAVTVPVEIAIAVKQDAATLSALQRKLEGAMALCDQIDQSINDWQDDMASRAARDLYELTDAIRALLGGDATTNEEPK